MSRPALRRVLLGAAIGLAAVLLAAGALAWWFVSTEAGARRAVALLGTALKGAVSVSRVEGPLRGPLVLHGVRYRTPTLDASIETLRLDWRLGELLRRRLDITRLAADRVRVATTPSKEPPSALPDLHLPVNVIVRAAEIRDVRLSSAAPDAGEPLVVDSIVLATSAIADTVRVERLEVRGPSLSASASGTLRPQGDYPVDLRVAWTATPAGRSSAWSGSGTLTGTLEELRVRHALSAPAAVRVDALLEKPLRDLSFDGTIELDRVRTTAVKPDAPEATLSGRIRASGALARFTARGSLDADVRANQLGRVHADVDVARAGDDWRIASAALKIGGTPARIGARGVVHMAAGAPPRLDLSLDWSSISWPLRGDATIRSAKGEGRVTGTTDQYALRVGADVEGRGLPRGRWTLEGTGTKSAMTLAALRGDLMGGEITGSGRVAWSPRAEWDFAVGGENLDPSAVRPDSPGRLGFEARTSGRIERDGPHGRFELARLDGTLRGQPVSASAAVALGGPTHRIERATLAAAGATAQASGTVGDALDLRWSVEAPELQALVADAAGTLRANGTVGGTRAAPHVRAAATGERLAWSGRSAKRVRLDADVDLARGGSLRLDVAASGVVPMAGGRGVDSLTMALRGTRADHAFRLDASGPDGSLVFAAAGALAARNEWSGRIRTLDLQGRQVGRWTLASPAPVSASKDAASLRDFCWTSGRARVCLAGEWRRVGESSGEATLVAVPFGLLAPWLPSGVEITGALEGRVAARMAAGGALSAEGRIAADGGEIRYPSAPGRPVAVAYRGASVEASSGARGLQVSLELPLTDVGRVGGSVSLPRYAENIPAAKQPLEGRIQASLRDLGVAQAFVTQAERIGGSVTADWSVGGTLGDPRLRGRLRLEGGRAELPDYGLEIRDASLTLSGDGSGPLALDAVVRAKEGEVRVAGRVPLNPTPATPVALTVTGQRFLALDTDERRLHVSPDLRLGYDGKTVTATGDVRVPDARIEYLKRLATVPVSADVVIVGREEEESTGMGGHAIDARVRLVLGDTVRIKAMGFEGRVDGSLLITEQTGRPTSATGEIVIEEGTYKAYGTDLTIERGSIRFAGPLNNPGLDLKASRKAQDGTVAGVTVKGSFKSPDVQIYSEPPMSQSDALAYLILGHPLGEATPAEGNLVANAATSLGVKAGNVLGKQVARKFGLETARIETTNGRLEQASLVVGKYLSPKLYLEYGLGIFDQVSRLRINYIINKKWTLRAETGQENGADVLYTLEK